jgi:CDP-diacylglycerol--serine O-phosphatidyltransferase
MSLADRLVDPKSPDRRPRRAAYALPTIFTAGNVYLGFYSLLKVFEGSMAMTAAATAGEAHLHFQAAALAIGLAFVLDGLDGRIARMTNTVSEFGREMDSLADVITFGIAPGVLAFSWGVFFVNQTVGPPVDPRVFQYLRQAGYFCAFLFLICGALRLARFNIQKNPMPKNPGRSDRKYFVGLPIPAGAALVASIVYASGSVPLADWRQAAGWLALLALLAFLMVSTWRYPSFKDVHLTRPRSPVTIVLYAAAIYLIWNFPQPAVFGMSVAYVLSGIVIRIGGLVRRRMRPPPPRPEHQIG